MTRTAGLWTHAQCSPFFWLPQHVVVVEEGKVALLYLVELTLSETAAMVRHAQTAQSGGILLYVLAEVCGIA